MEFLGLCFFCFPFRESFLFLLLLYLKIEAVNQISVKNPTLCVSSFVCCDYEWPLHPDCFSQWLYLGLFTPLI
jgi:hypothetical protein